MLSFYSGVTLFAIGLVPFLQLNSIIAFSEGSIGSIENQFLNVPLAWCILDGSPAVSNPSIPNEEGGFDTTTDDIILSRMQRVSNNIYGNIGISFSAPSSSNFPILEDQDPEGGLGNVKLGTGERIELINDCKNAWRNATNSDEPVGLIALNINRFIDRDTLEVTEILGSSICKQDPPGGIQQPCLSPYDGRVIVIDNFYTFNGVEQLNNDPLDQALGHELGHALGLGHSNQINALMHWEQQPNGAEGTVNNIELSEEEVVASRNNAQLIPRVEIVPIE